MGGPVFSNATSLVRTGTYRSARVCALCSIVRQNTRAPSPDSRIDTIRTDANRSILMKISILVLLGASSSPAQPQAPWAQAYPLTEINKPADLTELDGSESSSFLSEHRTQLPEHQIDPLRAIVSVDYPESVRSIRDATRYTLHSIGYSLVEQGERTAPELQTLLDAPLPIVQRQIHQVPVSEVLRALGGIGYVLVVDHIHRLVTFDPKPIYAELPVPAAPADIARAVPTPGSRPVVIVPATPLIDNATRTEHASLRERLGLTTTAQSLDGKGNVTQLRRSNFASRFEDYAEVEGRVLPFTPNSSTVRPEHNAFLAELLARLNPRTDLVSIIGCANDTPTRKTDHRLLAQARAHAVKSYLIAAGIDSRLILDEACWSDDAGNLPNHGAIVALKRRRGGE